MANGILAWGNGDSASYYDRQGVLTHEFGHALGLDDNNDSNAHLDGVNTTVSPLNIPTMFGYCTANYNNQWYSFSYQYRTLTQDDKNGKLAVEANIPGNP